LKLKILIFAQPDTFRDLGGFVRTQPRRGIVQELQAEKPFRCTAKSSNSDESFVDEGEVVVTHAKRIDRSFLAGYRRVAGLIAFAGAFLLSGAANALIIENLSSSSSFTYDFTPSSPGLNNGTGDNNLFEAFGSDPGKSTDVKVNYATVLANDASFFFLHNIQCQGYCSISVITTITDTITNTGTAAVDLRLDSAITAGHLGLISDALAGSSGLFQFDVSQHTNGVDHMLYDAHGQISSLGATITTSDGSVFNNMSSYSDPLQKGLDWDETDLSVLLDTIAPGQTTTVTYTSLTYLYSSGVCASYIRCDGVQVAFGDPRNNGGIFLLAKQLNSSIQQPYGYVLNRGFDTVAVRMDLVDVSGSVPEPGCWAMLTLGFGLIGAFVRRQRTAALVVAA